MAPPVRSPRSLAGLAPPARVPPPRWPGLALALPAPSRPQASVPRHAPHQPRVALAPDAGAPPRPAADELHLGVSFRNVAAQCVCAPALPPPHSYAPAPLVVAPGPPPHGVALPATLGL